MSTQRFFATVFDDSVHRLTEHDPLIRDGQTVEAVHQARVATRKLRSDLHTFGPVVDPQWAGHLRDELGWLGRALGRVRDADVLGALLRETASELADACDDGTAKVLGELAAHRDRARDELLEAMQSARYATLLDSLVDATRNPQMRNGNGSEPAHHVVPGLASEQWRRLRRSVRRLGDNPTDPELHKARRRAKQARYALEVSSRFDDRATRRANRAEGLQETLGDNQDRVVARRWLADLSADQPDNAFVAGELAGILRSQQTRIRNDALRKLHRFRDK